VTAFSPQFLDDLRARLPVSEIVGRTIKLKKKGSEFVGLSPFQTEKSPSFTVNDQKGFYHDFSSGKHGDIFSFLMETSGIDFRAAVVECAQVAGIPIPDDAGTPAQRNGAANGKMPHDDIPFDPDAYGAAPPPRASSKREITKAYDYTDGAGALLYQVCRLEWQDDGKFIRGRDGDWYQATEDRIQKWANAERQHFPIGVKHGLYRLMELREEAGDATLVYLPEGEKDVETLREMGLSATTNSGGARNWRSDHAEQLRGRDVVILLDNDEPGRDRGDIIARSLHGVARRIRLADFSAVWPDAPKGADVTDWVRQREGTVDELEEIVGRSPEWRPPPFVSQFGGISFEQLDDPGPEHAHVIDGLVTVGDKSVLAGPSQSGKSFLAIDMAMCIATGKPFFGRKIMTPGLVIYQAGEGGRGIKKRFRAWRQHFNIKKDSRVPLYILQSKVDIHSHEGDTAKLIAEIQGIERMYGMSAIALFVDTLQKAQGMADENSGRDMGTVMANVDRIAAAVPGCHVCLVHHMNAGGTKLRGHTSVYAGVDQVILVTKDPDTRVRTAVLDKQKDEEDGAKILFELMQVEIGYRAVDGKPITSCVTLPIGGQLEMRVAGTAKDRTVNLTNQQKNILTALKDALVEHGKPTPPSLKLPRSIATVVEYKHWRDAFAAIASDAEESAIKKALARAGEKLYALGIIGKINPYVWLTGRATVETPLDIARADPAAAQRIPMQEEFPE
jgi:hypothetical protein